MKHNVTVPSKLCLPYVPVSLPVRLSTSSVGSEGYVSCFPVSIQLYLSFFFFLFLCDDLQVCVRTHTSFRSSCLPITLDPMSHLICRSLTCFQVKSLLRSDLVSLLVLNLLTTQKWLQTDRVVQEYPFFLRETLPSIQTFLRIH